MNKKIIYVYCADALVERLIKIVKASHPHRSAKI